MNILNIMNIRSDTGPLGAKVHMVKAIKAKVIDEKEIKADEGEHDRRE